MIEVLSSILGGGLTGFLGSVFTGIMDYKTKKMMLSHEIHKIEAESKAVQVEAEAAIQREKARVEGEIEVADAAAFKESMEKGQENLFDKSYMKILNHSWGKHIVPIIAFLFAVVDFLRGLARPFVTYYLVGVSSWLTYLIYQMNTMDNLPQDDYVSILRLSLLTILYLTATCVSWWFGDRRVGKIMDKYADKSLFK